jgi:hypothetical protein
VKRVVFVPLFLFVAACADNAVLEIEMTFPRAPAGATQYAYVQSRSADTIDFSGDWAGADAPEGFLLSSTDTTTQHVSFVTSGAAITRQLGIRVRFCSDRVCGAIADTHAEEAQFVVERAFYRGHRTELPLTATPGAPVQTFTKCQVRGCTSGTPTSYCYDTTHLHFCE